MKQWKILIAHNVYIQPGGEDAVFRAEVELLRQRGHQVIEYVDENIRIENTNSVSIALQAIWSWETYAKFYRLLSDTHPDIVHFHNTFPLISPSAYYACGKFKIPVIQTLHNYRLFCPAAIFYREKAVCEECMGKPFFLPAIRHKCFQKSRLKTTVLVASLSTHHIMNTWQNEVNRYIALTQFSKNKFIESGLPYKKIIVKPNFVDDESDVSNASDITDVGKEKFVIFVGRLTPEKGIATLLKAWHCLNIPLLVFGDGPLKSLLESKDADVHYMGLVIRDKLFSFMQRASFLIFPSEWYEGFPMTIVEAFSLGLPVLSSDIGSQAEIVQEGYSGIHFRAGDPDDLALKSSWLWNHPEEIARLGQNARREYEEKYTPEQNYQMLMDVYQNAIDDKNNN